MEPTLHNWQLVILEKDPGELHRGDIIAFRCDALQTVLVKRIVALPGDTVQISNGSLYVNNVPSEVINSEKTIAYAGIAAEEIVLGNEYFVLGDNLEYSKDSRYSQIGCVQRSDIIGKVL